MYENRISEYYSNGRINQIDSAEILFLYAAVQEKSETITSKKIDEQQTRGYCSIDSVCMDSPLIPEDIEWMSSKLQKFVLGKSRKQFKKNSKAKSVKAIPLSQLEESDKMKLRNVFYSSNEDKSDHEED